MDQTTTLKLDKRGRVTIPIRIRDYFDMPDPDEEDVWIEVTVHGLDADKHPDHPMIAGGDE